VRRPRALLLAASAALASAAAATPTDPTLALTTASAATGTLTRTLRVEGAFQAEDLVQLAYPIQLLVRETTTGTSYVRYDLSGGAVTGTSAALADGLQAGEAEALLTQGTSAPSARVLFLGLGRLDVTLPTGFSSGPAEAVLFVLDAGEVILSNPMPVGSAP
jgi:hypothetical protein